MSKKILVPLDGSESAKNALRFTLSIVEEGDEIILLNVQKPEYEGYEKLGNITKDQLEAFYKERGERILKEGQNLVSNRKISVRIMVKLGLPALEIAKCAKENSVHSIVIGSKGMSPAVNYALGSVTYSVLHLAPCPVTIVPNE